MKSRITNLRLYAMSKVIRAREIIYWVGSTIDGARVEDALGQGSWVPILVSVSSAPVMISSNQCWQNQFVKKLGPLGLDPFRMLVVDIMHKCELGTWKALLTHLVRLLYTIPGGTHLVATLDARCVESIWSIAANYLVLDFVKSQHLAMG